jgi:hypothetical protein
MHKVQLLQRLVNHCKEYVRFIIGFCVSIYIHILFFLKSDVFHLAKLAAKFSEIIYSILLCYKLKTILQNHLRVCEKLDLNCSLVRLFSSRPVYFFLADGCPVI